MIDYDKLDFGIIYSALIHTIRTNSGIGFHNADQGHPAYLMGKSGKINEQAYGDSPQHSQLFQTLLELSNEFGGNWGPKIDSWESFCALAYDAYEQHQRRDT